jgi:hypothetical protein
MSADEQTRCGVLLDDAAVMIDQYNTSATEDIKKRVSCRMLVRVMGDGADMGIPIGASQGSMTGLSYTNSWTIGSGGATGELYVSKTEKKMLGCGNAIGSHSPLEDLKEDSGGI